MTAIINTRKLATKMNKQRQYWECSVKGSTEAWLQGHILYSNASLHNFTTMEADRDCRQC